MSDIKTEDRVAPRDMFTGNPSTRVLDPMMSMDSEYEPVAYYFELLAPETPGEFQFVSDHYLDVTGPRDTTLGR